MSLHPCEAYFFNGHGLHPHNTIIHGSQLTPTYFLYLGYHAHALLVVTLLVLSMAGCICLHLPGSLSVKALYYSVKIGNLRAKWSEGCDREVLKADVPLGWTCHKIHRQHVDPCSF